MPVGTGTSLLRGRSVYVPGVAGRKAKVQSTVSLIEGSQLEGDTKNLMVQDDYHDAPARLVC